MAKPLWYLTPRADRRPGMMLNGGSIRLGDSWCERITSVRVEARLQDGYALADPRVLDVCEAFARQIDLGNRFALRDEEGVMLAVCFWVFLGFTRFRGAGSALLFARSCLFRWWCRVSGVVSFWPLCAGLRCCCACCSGCAWFCSCGGVFSCDRVFSFRPCSGWVLLVGHGWAHMWEDHQWDREARRDSHSATQEPVWTPPPTVGPVPPPHHPPSGRGDRTTGLA